MTFGLRRRARAEARAEASAPPAQLAPLPDPPIEIGDVYGAPADRRGTDLRFGEEWTRRSEPHARFAVYWVPRTHELLVMRKTPPSQLARTQQPIVERLGVVTKSALEGIMEGWETAMALPNSVGWVRARLRSASLSHPRPRATAARPKRDVRA
jgi:hypothetical protein